MARPPARRRRNPVPYHHGDLARAVLDEAAAMIATHGVPACNLREIARRIGVSHAAPYRHFADRRAVLTALHIEGSERLAGAIEQALIETAGDLRRQFLAAGHAYVRFALDHPGHFQAMFSTEVDHESPLAVVAKGRSFGLLLAYIAEAQRAKLFEAIDPARLATPIWAMHHGLATLAAAGAFDDHDDAGLRRTVDDAHARLLDGLLVVRPPAPAPGRHPKSKR